MTPGGVAIRWDAIVPAGGQSRRMGTDKLALEVDGMTLFDRVLLVLSAADRVVVVGPERPTARDVVWCREDPLGGGPAAAVGAGLAQVTSGFVVLMAADQPFADRAVVADLLAAIDDADGAVAVDDSGQPQWLCSAWRTDALIRAPLGVDVSLRASIGGLRWHAVHVDPRVTVDCDTPEDLRRARELADQKEPAR